MNNFNFMRKWNLTLLALAIFSTMLIAQNPNSDKLGNLEIKGEIKTDHSNYGLCTCIKNANFLDGVKAFTKSEKAAEISAFVMGEIYQNYLVNDFSTEAGEVQFKYEFIIKDGVLSYRFFHFYHAQKESEFSSAGRLSSEWNKEIGKVFNKGQYWEIVNEIQTNVANTIRALNKECMEKK